VPYDQLMALHTARTPGTDAYVRIYNSDGSEAGACGNGMRCIAELLFKETGKPTLTFETKAGLLDCWKDDAPGLSTVDMGAPRFAWNEIPLAAAVADTRAIDLQIGPAGMPILRAPSVVSMGNPHAIFWVGDINDYDLAKLGPPLEHDPIFPERANISLAQVASREHIVLRTWERGAGLTRACGSAACAAAVGAPRSHRPRGNGDAAGRRPAHLLARTRRPRADDRSGGIRIRRQVRASSFCQTGSGVDGQRRER
jgi:diaminopimelate epimerase